MTIDPKEHPDALHIIAGSQLAIVFEAWIQAFAEDRDPPSVYDALSGNPHSIRSLEVCRALLGVRDETGGKVRLVRFLGALCDVIARDGAELQCMMHATLKPDEPEMCVLAIPAAELEKLQAIAEVRVEEVAR